MREMVFIAVGIALGLGMVLISLWYVKRIGNRIDVSGQLFLWCQMIFLPSVTVLVYVGFPDFPPLKVLSVGLRAGFFLASVVWAVITGVLAVAKAAKLLWARLQDTQ